MAKPNNYNNLPNPGQFQIGPEATEIPRKSARSHTVRYKTLYDNRLRRFIWAPRWKMGKMYTVDQCCFEAPGINLGVGLGRGHMFMAQRLLDQPDIAGLVVEPGCERMPQRVGRDRLGDSSLGHFAGHQPLDLPGGDPLARRGGPKRYFTPYMDHQGLQRGHDGRMQGNPVGIAALGRGQGDGSLLEVNVLPVQGDGLTQTTASQQQKSNNSPVPLSVPASELPAQDRSDFLFRKYDWWQASIASAFQDGRGVSGNKPPGGSPGEQGLQADPVAVDGGLGALRSTRANLDALVGHESGEGGWSNIGDGHGACELGEDGEVSSVGSHGVW